MKKIHEKYEKNENFKINLMRKMKKKKSWEMLKKI